MALPSVSLPALLITLLRSRPRLRAVLGLVLRRTVSVEGSEDAVQLALETGETGLEGRGSLFTPADVCQTPLSVSPVLSHT